MIYKIFGRTGLKVSQVGHGLWGMGDWTDSSDEESMQALRKSLELGCNFYDSAWSYGRGNSDKLLGRLIHENPGAEIITASKIPPKNFKWPASSEYPVQDVFPGDHIIDYTHRILKNLGTETIDVLQLHVWDDSWAESEELHKTVAGLKSQGLIRFFGLSLNRWEPWNGIKAIRLGFVDAVQVIYNIFDQAPEDQLFPLCKEMNIGVIARVPLDEGGLAGYLTKDTKFPDNDWRASYFCLENLIPTVDRAESLKGLLPAGMTLPEMALRFVYANDIVSTTIVGMRNLMNVESNIAWSEGRGLPPYLLQQLRPHRWDRKPAPWAD